MNIILSAFLPFSDLPHTGQETGFTGKNVYRYEGFLRSPCLTAPFDFILQRLARLAAGFQIKNGQDLIERVLMVAIGEDIQVNARPLAGSASGRS